MDLAVVVVLDPGQRRLVQKSQCEVGHVLEHGEQPTLDGTPEHLLLAVLVGRIWKNCLVQDAEPRQSFDNLRGGHSSTIVAHSCAREPPVLERLRGAVSEGMW